jgi:outer membrane protein TolC
MGLCAAGTASPSAPLDWKAAIHYAVENSPTLNSSMQNAHIAELQQKRAFTKFLPSLDFASTHGLAHVVPTPPTDPWASSLSLQLSETLYDNGESITNYRLSGIQKEIASLNYLKARETLSLSVSQAFFTYSLDRKLTELRHQQLDILDKQYRTVSNQYRQGLRMRNDFLRLKSQVQRADLDARNADKDIEAAVFELRRLMGVTAAEPEVKFLPMELQQLEKLPPDPPSLEQVPEYRIAKAQVDQNPLNISLAKRRNGPQFILTGGANYLNSGYLHSGLPFSGTQSDGFNILLQLNYNIWDWGSRRHDIEIAESQATIQENSLRQSELDLRAQLKTLMLDLGRFQDNYQLSEELLASSQESYDFLKKQYEEGQVQYLDLITSLNELLDAKVRYYTAYFDLSGSHAKYHYYQGNLYDTVSF